MGSEMCIRDSSKEVSMFADRSLELRDGRFVAEHGRDVDVEDLSAGRELIVDDFGTVTLPPDLLTRMGGPGRYSVGDVSSGNLRLVGEEVSEMGELVLASICPACKHDYGDDEAQQCPTCGASRPMVESAMQAPKRS